MTVTSEPRGTTLYDYFKLIMSLEEYPTATPAVFDVRISYRECYPFDFSGPIFNDLKLKVGETSDLLDFYFD